jgi:hypothetical protein
MRAFLFGAKWYARCCIAFDQIERRLTMSDSEEKRHQQPHSAPNPNAAEIEPENRRLDQHPHQTAEVPYGSGNEPEVAGKGGFDAQDAELPRPANKHTEPLQRK